MRGNRTSCGGAFPPRARAMAVSVRTPGHSAAGETGISLAPWMTDTVIHRDADADTRDSQNTRQPPWMVGTPLSGPPPPS